MAHVFPTFQHIHISDTLRKQFGKLDALHKRIVRHDYKSWAAHVKEHIFYDDIIAEIEICKWMDDHFDEFKTDEHGRLTIGIKLPVFHTDTQHVETEIVDGYVQLMHSNDGYHWFSVSHDFMGRRLDWQPRVFNEILQHQYNIDEWAADYMQTLMNTDYWWMNK